MKNQNEALEISKQVEEKNNEGLKTVVSIIVLLIAGLIWFALKSSTGSKIGLCTTLELLDSIKND